MAKKAENKLDLLFEEFKKRLILSLPLKYEMYIENKRNGKNRENDRALIITNHDDICPHEYGAVINAEIDFSAFKGYPSSPTYSTQEEAIKEAINRYGYEEVYTYDNGAFVKVNNQEYTDTVKKESIKK